MYEQPALDNALYFMLYAAVAMLCLIASCYLFFRRGNAFVSDMTTPVSLRRWTGAFFAIMALAHLWYLPIIYFDTADDVRLCYFVGGVLDSMTVLPVAICVLYSMLQDRRRPLWPAFTMAAPLAIGLVWCAVSRNDAILPMMYGYLLLLCIIIIIYMVRALREYRRWLRDNFADLEHKEVRQTFMVLVVILLYLSYYASGQSGPAYKYIVQVVDVILVCYLLWRVETLSDLSISQPLATPVEEETTSSTHDSTTLAALPIKNIKLLLQENCIDTKLYLQHDLTLLQLAKAIGVNRFYLSQYFSSQGVTYNGYVNDLRIQHFVSLYREAVATERHFTVQQLAHDSGYRSYSTFSLAFKQRMGQNVSAWIHDSEC